MGALKSGMFREVERKVESKVKMARWRWQGGDSEVEMARWRWRGRVGDVETGEQGEAARLEDDR